MSEIASENDLQTCNNNGCKQKYKASENHATSCKHHSGKPIFHDFKKGWTCCNVIVYDWDEFQKIEACQVGPHVPKPTATGQPAPNQAEFFQSQTVQRAEGGLRNFGDEPAKPAKTIDEFNREQEAALAQKKLSEAPKQLFVTPSGKLRCANKGCNKEYLEEENGDQVCQYHEGAPVFHDVKKYWTCCKKETWDWDEFVKLPTCCVGRHVPKYK